MGKTYEALEWAEREYQAGQEMSRKPVLAGPAEPPRRVSTHQATKRFDDLKTNLLTRYPDESIKTILFAGSTHGEGTSTTAVNFATTLAKNPTLKVLLIDVNLRTPSLHDVFKIDPLRGLCGLVTNGGEVPPVSVWPGNLHVIPCGGHYSEPVTLFESTWFYEFLKSMRDTFDFVILDGPPVHGFSECRVLCNKVDGVILVIESGKTHRQVALSAKKQVEEAGGKLLGVVLNKRKYYIPEFIYRWL